MIYTEDYKPLYYQDENGRILGTATDLVRQVASDAGIDLEHNH